MECSTSLFSLSLPTVYRSQFWIPPVELLKNSWGCEPSSGALHLLQRNRRITSQNGELILFLSAFAQWRTETNKQINKQKENGSHYKIKSQIKHFYFDIRIIFWIYLALSRSESNIYYCINLLSVEDLWT